MSQAIAQLVTLTLNPQIARRIRRTKFRPPKPPRVKPEPKPKRPHSGRPKMPDEKWAQIKRLAEDPTLSCNQIARVVGVAYSTVTKYRRENGLVGPGSPGAKLAQGGG
jgi:DNA invertase Pin-like site-specific DNA recombinase